MNQRRMSITLLHKPITVLLLSVTLGACAFTGQPTGDARQLDTPQGQPGPDLFLLSVEAQRAYKQSRWIDAVRLYQQLIEQVPSDAAAWFRLANTYTQQGGFDRAIYAYEQSLTYDADQPKAWFNLSTVYLLNAQNAMQQAHAGMRQGDPARAMIETRLQKLSQLIHSRLEEANDWPIGASG
jgi:tetratricopeptide (TPR) repeat protein